jgi:hypothetical protein
VAGYSGKSVAQELGIQPGFCIFTADAPGPYDDIVGMMRVGDDPVVMACFPHHASAGQPRRMRRRLTPPT